MLKRIAITGTESTGKTWLTKRLSQHYNVNMVSEYVRDYFSNKEYKYTVDDILSIAKQQLINENEMALLSDGMLFCDTDLLVLKIWSKFVFNFVPPWIEKKLTDHVYDLYLLCYPDLDWEPDPLRNKKYNRQYIYSLFVNELEFNNFNYKIVSGFNNYRFENAVGFINKFIENEKR